MKWGDREWRDQARALQQRAAAAPSDAVELAAIRQEAARLVLEPHRLGEATPRIPAALLASVAVGVLVLAVAGYAWKGQPGLAGTLASAPAATWASPEPVAATDAPVGNTAPAQTSAGTPEGALSAEQMAQLTERLAERLKTSPGDAAGWNMLGRSYLALGRTGEAVQAQQQAVRLSPANADYLADHADALAVANGRRMNAQAEAQVVKALALQPDHVKSLVLAAAAARERGDMGRAATLFERVAALAPADSPLPAQARQAAAQARAQAGPAAPAAVTTPPPAAGRIEGVVSLSPALAARVQPDDTVFIVARPAGGPGMPLAVVRIRAAELPYRFVLDDSQAMSPQARLSQAERVTVVARLSRSGQAMPASGDLESAALPAVPGSTGLSLVLSQMRP